MLAKETKEGFRRIELSHKDPLFMNTKPVLFVIYHNSLMYNSKNLPLFISLSEIDKRKVTHLR